MNSGFLPQLISDNKTDMNFRILYLRSMRIVFILYLIPSVVGCAFAQDTLSPETPTTVEWDPGSPYYKAMAANIRQLDTIISRDNLLRVISSFERIIRVEKDKALPRYYMALALTTLAFREKDVDEIDVLCDRSERALNDAESLTGVNQAEILVIRAFIEYARLQVDFMGRGMEASQKAESFLRKGHQLDQENPRVLAVLAQHYLRIPAQVGGSREKFCQIADVAAKAYESERARMPEGIYPIIPHWGEVDLLEVQAKFCFSKPAANTTNQP